MLCNTFYQEIQEVKSEVLLLGSMVEGELIDKCYTDLCHEAMNSVLLDARYLERANYVIWAAHNLERLGNRATSICERIVYVVTGKISESFMMTGQLKPVSDNDTHVENFCN